MKSLHLTLLPGILFFAASWQAGAQTATIHQVLAPLTSPDFRYTNTAPVTGATTDYGFRLSALGQNGSNHDDKDGGNAGNVGTIQSFLNAAQSPVSLTRVNPSAYKGAGLLLDLTGGNGGNYTDENGKHNAGYGGNTGSITGTNAAALGAQGRFSNGLALWEARTTGGNGGSTTPDDYDYRNPKYNEHGSGSSLSPLGRPGANAEGVTLTNSGILTMGTSAAPVEGAGAFEGIRAATLGGNAGTGLLGSVGGAAGAVSLTHSGVMEFYLKSGSANGTVTSAYGLLGQATGGQGSNSYKTGYSGGQGGTASGVTVQMTAGGRLMLSYQNTGSVAEGPVGAGIGAFSTGGKGGLAWNGDSDGQGNAGTGGTAGPVAVSMVDADLRVIGDALGGIRAVAGGGQGGDGTNNQKSFGGPGGAGGTATVNFTQTGTTPRLLSTAGSKATGVFAASQGGNGGNSPISYQLAGGTSGDGGFGGRGNAASITLDGPVRVATAGASSPGLVSQSAGGNGGFSGGLSTIVVGTGNGGGKGGVGGTGGTAALTLQNGAMVATTGTESHGLLATSEGGSGGSGGQTHADALGDGGPGGRGGDGGAVVVAVNPTSSVQTQGISSHAVMAQSLSGAGGIGGLSNVTIAGKSGLGGAAGNSGTITIDNAGLLMTAGSDAYGILAQGTSGNGGDSGSASSVFVSQTAFPGASGAVRDISINQRGSISTTGESAYGILAQSLSGNGGASGRTQLGVFSSPATGGSAASGGTVRFTQNGGTTSTSGDKAHAVNLQSLGGGGGDGGSATGLIAVGGNSGSGGNGGTVSAQLPSGILTTFGENAHALYATSTGGRGGNGGNANGLGVGVALTIGGTGGAGGRGGPVDITSAASLNTFDSKANGILAQSIGGGGGNGGAALSLSVAPVLSVAVAIGGKGSDGQLGGPVNINQIGGSIWTGQNAASITTPSNTLPSDAIGILAQSIGGGGGNGGVASASALAIAVPVQVPGVPQVALGISSSVGGAGGRGGNGDTARVLIEQGSQLITQGQGSHGVLSQSIGGGGGNGGDSSASAATIGYFRVAEQTEQLNLALNVAVGLGGNGGSGGNGGQSNATLGGAGAASNLATFGDFSNGLISQSIGGGGGNAGFGSGTTRAYGAAYSITTSVGLGGDGGSGGNGGAATGILNFNNGITTLGAGSHGMLVQSIGGGGGISQGGAIGMSAEAGLPFRGKQPAEFPGGHAERPRGSFALGARLELELGATSGSGGDAGSATAMINGQITTEGNDASGVILQSIGGGGGLAGGGGSEASHDAEEAPTHEGSSESFSLSQWLENHDTNENLKFARADFSKLLFKQIPLEFEMKLSLGSFDAGASGRGGDLSLAGNGRILTQGDWSHGILAQSIGGGGGKADSAVGQEQEARAELGFNIGGIGKRFLNTEIGERTASNTATGADGGNITANWDGLSIATGSGTGGKGLGAMGIILQTIGGGGGIGVDGSALAKGNISVGSTATVESDGKVTGDGGYINATGRATISTTGAGAHGLVAQSIGGGGGIGGAGSSIEVVDANQNDLNSEINVRVGGNPYSTGRGGNIALAPDNSSLSLDIRTSGASAYGILAQSIGGGGGLAAVMDPTGSAITGTESASGGTTRNSGGSISFNLDSATRISTSGTGAHAIVAQSIGAGGGIAGYRSDAAFRVSEPRNNLYAYGNASSINLYLAPGSLVSTTGARAHGILAQSIGGEGGLFGGQAGRNNALGSGSGDSLYLTVAGNVRVSGEGSYGLFGQTDGATQDVIRGTNLSVSGSIASAGTAIYLSGGRNVINIKPGGIVSGINALESFSSQAPVINNAGTWQGSLLHNSNALPSIGNNIGSASLAAVAIPTVSRAQFYNTGTVFPGSRMEADVFNSGEIHLGFSPTRRTTITGSLIQSRTGALIVDGEDRRQTGALLTVQGNATLEGRIQPVLSRIRARHNVKLIDVQGRLENRAVLDLSRTAARSRVFELGLREENRSLYLSTVAADFSPDDVPLTENATEVADHLGGLWKGKTHPQLDALFENLDTFSFDREDAYDRALLELSPGATLGFAAQAASTQQSFLTSALDAQKFVGDSANPTGTQSVWARTSGGQSRQEVPGRGIHDYTVSTSVTEVGAQWTVSPGLVVGGTLGFQYDDLQSDAAHVTGDGQTGLAALTAKYEQNDWLFAAALSGSAGAFDTTRRLSIPGHETEAEGHPEVQSLGFLLRAAHTFHNDTAYLRPRLDVGLIHVRAGAVSESGPSRLRLDLEASQQTSFLVTPGLEVGLRTNLPNGMILHSYASGSLTFQTANAWEQDARFSAAPAGVGSFSTSLPQDQITGRLIVGAQLQLTKSLSSYLQYEGSFSADSATNGGSVGLRLDF